MVARSMCALGALLLLALFFMAIFFLWSGDLLLQRAPEGDDHAQEDRDISTVRDALAELQGHDSAPFARHYRWGM